MTDETQRPADTNKSERFIELAKINQENLWKRRSIEWKVNFGLWTALGIAAGFSYKEGLGLSLSQHQGAIWFLLGGVFIAYVWNNLGTVISNEKDLDWLIYYKSLAANELAPKDEETHDQPDPKWGFYHYVCRGGDEEEAKLWEAIIRPFKKLYTVFAPTMVTLSLLLVLRFIVSSPIGSRQEGGKPSSLSSPAGQIAPTNRETQSVPDAKGSSIVNPPTTSVPR